MSADLISISLSNSVIALVLGGLALLLRRSFPQVAHLILVLALIKLVVPWGVAVSLPFSVSELGWIQGVFGGLERGETHGMGSVVLGVLLSVWSVGVVVVAWRIVRDVVSSDRLLTATCERAPDDWQVRCQSLSRTLGVKTPPTVWLSAAQLSPMIWWAGGRVRLVIPMSVARALTEARLDLVLAHELAHVARRDHWVRCLELAVRAIYWWNPLVGWLHSQLREVEETCCDFLVIARLDARPLDYAESMVSAVSSLRNGSGEKRLLVASGIDGGGTLEKRIQSLFTSLKQPIPIYRLAGIVVLVGCIAMPVKFGLPSAQPLVGDGVALGVRPLNMSMEPPAIPTAPVLGAQERHPERQSYRTVESASVPAGSGDSGSGDSGTSGREELGEPFENPWGIDPLRKFRTGDLKRHSEKKSSNSPRGRDQDSDASRPEARRGR